MLRRGMHSHPCIAFAHLRFCAGCTVTLGFGFEPDLNVNLFWLWLDVLRHGFSVVRLVAFGSDACLNFVYLIVKWFHFGFGYCSYCFQKARVLTTTHIHTTHAPLYRCMCVRCMGDAQRTRGRRASHSQSTDIGHASCAPHGISES